MAIVGIGLDVVDLQRIRQLLERFGDGFIRRICAEGECQQRQGDGLVEHVGGLFAAKEAALKALGTGWAQGLSLRMVEIVRQPGGAPALRLHQAAAERAALLGVTATFLSISHERTYAAAVAILERDALSSTPSTAERSP